MKENNNGKIKIALVDDHIILRNALASLIDNFGDCTVINQSDNGQELISSIRSGIIPDIVILDLSMPVMDGFEVAQWLNKYKPQIHVLMLTMYDSELSLIRLLQAGVKGFMKKDIHPSELKFAIHTVMQKEYYYSNSSTSKLINLFRKNEDGKPNLQNSILTEQEANFLKLCCTDLTYKEIALKLGLNPRTIDTMRDQLFHRLDVRSRVGLVMVALRHGIVTF